MEKKKEFTDLAITLSFGVVLFVFVFLLIVWIINLIKYKFQQYVQRSRPLPATTEATNTTTEGGGCDNGTTTRRRGGSFEYEEEQQKPRGSVRSRGK